MSYFWSPKKTACDFIVIIAPHLTCIVWPISRACCYLAAVAVFIGVLKRPHDKGGVGIVVKGATGSCWKCLKCQYSVSLLPKLLNQVQHSYKP